MIPKSQLQDMRVWWVRVTGNPYRNSVLRLIDSHLVALEKIEALQAALAALWACPTVQADYDAMHTGEPLTLDAQKYRDALAELERMADKDPTPKENTA